MPESTLRGAVHLVCSGYIKRYSINKEGDESIQVVYGPGDIFPLTPIFKALYGLDIYHGPETFYYEAMSESEIASLSSVSLKEAADSDAIFYKDLMFVAGQRLDSNIQQLENMSLRSTNRRIAHYISYCARKFGEPDGQGIRLAVPLTHQNIADALNVARETISRRLGRLEEKGLIISGKHIVVLDTERLAKEYS